MVERDEDVVVEVNGIRIGRVLVLEWEGEAHRLPRTRAHEVLARNFAERAYEPLGSQIGGLANQFRVSFSRGNEIIHARTS
jgi:hypothetical protein